MTSFDHLIVCVSLGCVSIPDAMGAGDLLMVLAGRQIDEYIQFYDRSAVWWRTVDV